MGRGKTQASLDLIDAAHEILEAIKPATVRAVCYRLFIAGVLRDMSKAETNKVSAQLVFAREVGFIPWAWIVDETRQVERVSQWDNPGEILATAARTYRKDCWRHQPYIVEVWSEKGTVRGTLQPVLHEYGVAFRVFHGYASATVLNEIAEAGDDRVRIALYVGDYDPSGLHMSEIDLPERLARYGARVLLERVALLDLDLEGLPSFATDSKRTDQRWRWYRSRYGERCWELDAMSPTTLRERVVTSIETYLDRDAWDRCQTCMEAEQESLRLVLERYNNNGGGGISGPAQE